MNVCTKFELCSFIRSWDNRGTQKSWAVPGYAHAVFSPQFFMDLFGWILWLWMYRPNLPSVALPVPEIIAIAVLGWDCEPQSWGRESRMWSGAVPFERALVSSYRPSVVTFHLSLRVSEILPLLSYLNGEHCDVTTATTGSTNSPHSTSSLPKISSCSPGSRWMAFGLRTAKMLG